MNNCPPPSTHNDPTAKLPQYVCFVPPFRLFTGIAWGNKLIGCHNSVEMAEPAPDTIMELPDPAEMTYLRLEHASVDRTPARSLEVAPDYQRCSGDRRYHFEIIPVGMVVLRGYVQSVTGNSIKIGLPKGLFSNYKPPRLI